MAEVYNHSFYTQQQDGSLRSAKVLVPLILALTGARRVADVGCGVGTWASVFLEAGLQEVRGYDGDYVRPEMLNIPPALFTPADLTRPWAEDQTFDLALCLEVGEHLPAVAAATLVQSLTRIAPVVVFSAAIPFQGGTSHIHEQWPSYWAGLFAREGYVTVDALRSRVWTDEAVEPFYRQNTLIYVRRDCLSHYPELAKVYAAQPNPALDVVHPKIYLGRNAYPLAPVGHLLAWTLRRLASELKRKLVG